MGRRSASLTRQRSSGTRRRSIAGCCNILPLTTPVGPETVTSYSRSQSAQRMARTRETSSISTRSLAAVSIRRRTGASIAQATFVDEPSVRVERRGTAGDHPLAAAKDLAPEEHDEIPQHRAERERRAALDPEPAHPDVQNRVALSPAPLDLDEADREGDVGGRRQPHRSGGAPGGRRLHHQLRAAVGSRREQTSDVELATTVGEIDHGAGRVRRAARHGAEGEHEISAFAGHADHERVAPSLLAPDPQRGRGDPPTQASKKSDVHGQRILSQVRVMGGTVLRVGAVTK